MGLFGLFGSRESTTQEISEVTLVARSEEIAWSPIVRLLDAIMTDAVALGASEVHFTPCVHVETVWSEEEQAFVPAQPGPLSSASASEDPAFEVSLTIDDKPLLRRLLPPRIGRQVVNRLKVMAHLDGLSVSHQSTAVSFSVDGQSVACELGFTAFPLGDGVICRILTS